MSAKSRVLCSDSVCLCRRYGIALLLGAALALQAATASATGQAAEAYGHNQFDAAAEAQLVDLINLARTAAGLPTVAVDERLRAAARKHSQLMAQHATLSHQFDGEPAMEQRLADEGMPSDREAENVGFDPGVAVAHEAFLHSPAHRANILDGNYNTVGVGVVRSGGNLYITEDFARRLPQYSEVEAEAVVQEALNRQAASAGLASPARKPQPQLREMACSMALNDTLDNKSPAELPNVHEVMVWTAGDPRKLPSGVAKRFAQAVPSGYSLGACFAPSVSHPGGLYWIVIVTY